MEITPSQGDIIKAAAAFSSLDRYQGALPKKHALIYDEDDLAVLINDGLLETMRFTFSCGRQSEGLRLTALGREALAGLPQDEPEDALDDGLDELAPEHIDIMNDIYHFSKITKNKGVMPKELSRRYVAEDLDDLFSRGYILRVKVKVKSKADAKSAKPVKGYVLSSKGLRIIRERNRA